MPQTVSNDVSFDITSTDLFESAVRRNPARPFLYFEGDWWTYEQTQQASWGYAAQLLDAGIGVGDRVLTITRNEPRTVAIHFALSWVGASYAPVIPKSTADELEFMITNTRPRAAVVGKEHLDTFAPILARHGVPVLVLEEERRTEAPGERPALDGSAEFSIMYTSGSTGRPKGVVIPHCGVISAAYMWSVRMELGADDVVLGQNPQFHVGGMKNVAIAMACGGGYMMQEQFSRSRFWGDVRQSGATSGVLMPAMMSILLTDDPKPDDLDNPLRTVVSHVVNREFQDRFGIDIILTWGMSELSGNGVLTCPGYDDKQPGLAGWPSHDQLELKVCDDDANEVALGETGEIWARHPWQFTGYLNDEAGTRETIVDGWILSGDLGHLDDQGRLYFDGRKKNMIKRAGENVSGPEVEQCLVRHPGVSEAAVFGVPDPIRTEEVKAVVKLRPGAEVALVDLVRWCEASLAPFKVPRYWEIRDDLPRAAISKVNIPLMKREHESEPGWDRTAT